MRRFVFTILLSAVAVLFFNAALDIAISLHLQRADDRRYEGWNDMINGDINADVLFMGSSRARVHFSPMIIDSIAGTNSYNMGVDGYPLYQQIVKYEVYDHYQQKKPSLIVITVGYFGTFGLRTGYEREQYFPHLMIPFVREQYKRIEPFTFAELYIPLYRYITYKGLYGVLTETPGIYDVGLYKGYKPLDRGWDGTAFNLQKSWHFSYDEFTMQKLDEFIAARKSEGIEILFCYPPIYTGLTRIVDNLDECYNTYQSLADKYDIRILDYTYSELSADTTYLYNATHLNKNGAELFSRRFAHDLDSLNILH